MDLIHIDIDPEELTRIQQPFLAIEADLALALPALLAEIAGRVYTIEIKKGLHERATETLRKTGFRRVMTRHGDGYFGWKEEAPFDAIIVTCAAGHLPPPLWEQLKVGGRMVIPVGGPYEVQRLVLATKQSDGSRQSKTITLVRFVPVTRGEDQ